jgi:rhodanese-related sulfurtransferase
LATLGIWFPSAEPDDCRRQQDHPQEHDVSVRTITPRRLEELRTSGQPVHLIDVRTPAEFREVHVPFAQNVPLDRLDPAAVARLGTSPPDQPLYLICRSGARGQKACEKLTGSGFTNVVNVEGGTQAWAEAGLPVVRGKKAISLERQVRIAAGLLVLIGVVLGWLIHPACSGLAAFVGAGLVFAGVTDTCGMGLVLAQMPWNRVKDPPAECCGTKEVCP